MAGIDEEVDKLTLSFDNWNLEGDSKIIELLGTQTACEVFKNHHAYKVSVIHAARRSRWDFLKQLALGGLYTTLSATLGENSICTDLINSLKSYKFDEIQKFLKENTDKNFLWNRSCHTAVTSLLFYGCPPECLEILRELDKKFSDKDECKRQLDVNEFPSNEHQNALDKTDRHGFSPLISAVLAGNLPCVQYLLEKGANVDFPDSLFTGELHSHPTGIDYKWSVPLEMSLQRDSFYSQQRTPLMFAVCVGNVECIKVLLKFKPDLAKTVFRGQTVLDYAAKLGDFDCFNVLLNRILESESGNNFDKMGSQDGSNLKLDSDLFTKSDSNVFGDTNLAANTVVGSETSTNGSLEKFTFSPKPPVFDFKFNSGDSKKPFFTLGKGQNDQPVTSSKLSRSVGNKKGKKPQNAFKCKSAPYWEKIEKFPNVRYKILAETALPFAVMGGNIQCVQLLLKHCSNPNAVHTSGKTALIFAVEQGKSELVKLLLENWANVDKPTKGTFTTPLMSACINDHPDCVKLLLQHKANKEVVSCNETALMYASRNGRIECLKILLEHKANLEAENANGQTALFIAVECEKNECVKVLLDHNVNIGKRDCKNMSALAFAAKKGNTHCLELLVNALKGREDQAVNMDFLLTDVKNDGIDTSLFDFTTNPSFTATNTLDKPEHNISSKKNESSLTVLTEESLPYAVEGGNEKCFELLLPLCVNLNRLDNTNKTALMLACEKGNVDFVNRLLGNKADVEFQKDKNDTALILAASHGQNECLKILLEHGAKVDYENFGGDKALVVATEKGHLECVRLLLDHGANPNTCKYSSMSVLSIAAMNGLSECLCLLIKSGANVNYVDSDRKTTMMYATSRQYNEECMKILSNAKASIDIVDCYKSDVLQHILPYPKNVKFLLSEGKLVMSRKVSALELDALERPYLHTTENTFRSVELLLEYGVFDWRYWCQLESNIPLFIFLGVNALVPTGDIFHEGAFVSPLQYGLLTEDEGLVRYLISNLYFHVSDYRVIIQTNFRNRLLNEDNEEDLSQSFKSVVRELCFKPWNLQTLSLLAISSALSTGNRIQKVESLPIPDKFKTILKFKRGHSRLCFLCWDEIGNPSDEEPEEILWVTKGTFPPDHLLTTHCRRDCECYGLGFELKD